VIFHIATSEGWRVALGAGSYSVVSLELEGFVHMSTAVQVLSTASRYYRGVEGLVLLVIDEARLDPGTFRYDIATGGDSFPHYYAPIPLTAIVGVHSFPPSPDGSFDWPVGLP
jgi:uncharacterized protein (DUF952 family)